MKQKKAKTFMPEISMYSDTIELKAVNNLHDCIDVTSIVGQLLFEALDKSARNDLFCILKAAIEGTCC